MLSYAVKRETCLYYYLRVILLHRLRPPEATRPDTLFPPTTLFRSRRPAGDRGGNRHDARPARRGARCRRDRHVDRPRLRAGQAGADRGGDPPSRVARPGRRPLYDASPRRGRRSAEHKSELQSLMRITYAVLCCKKRNMFILLFACYFVTSTATPRSHTS